MEPIETEYKGYRFRSRLEARWAVIFEWLGVEWRYEPQGYQLESYGCYLPDFKLPNFNATLAQVNSRTEAGIWIEIKGGQSSTQEREKMRVLAEKTKRPSVIFCGVGERDNAHLFTPPGDYAIATAALDLLSYIMAHNFPDGVYGNCMEAESALKKGRKARFEHGQKGAV